MKKEEIINEEILELDYHKMIKEIDKLVQTDFVFDMECMLISKKHKYTQKEAREMAKLLSTIYSISHIEHCKACRTIKYAKKHIIKLLK